MLVTALVCSAATAAAQTRDPAALAAALEPRIASAIEDGRIAGMSVAVVRGRDTLLMRAYGRADVERGVPTPERAVYEIGSVTKQFTAAAILQLQERGMLSLDDLLSDHLPDFPTQGHRVTLRRLLDHTSGIHGMHSGDPEFRAVVSQALPRDTLLALYRDKPFVFAPGSAMLYNNTAYILLGDVIERVSGMPYEAYVRRHLFAPAGMDDSSYCASDGSEPGKVPGHAAEDGALRRSEQLDHRWTYAAGALCSTAGDLVAWTQALHGGRILGPDAYRLMITPEPLDDGVLPRYGKGVVVNPIRGHRAIHHGGTAPGYQSHVAHFPDDSLTVVVLANTLGGPSPQGATELIVRTLLGDRSEPGVEFAGRTEDYVGEYRGSGSTAGAVLHVSADSAGRLTARLGAGRAAPLVYFGGETFGRGDARYTFLREGGAVRGLRVDGGTTIGVLVRDAEAMRSVAEPRRR